ncbi:CinA family nicotinamide mononucleotide deamidase-related protein [Bergeyella zoohelcum]|uniref:CinA-like protein n=1 Tax=Bergeyella zoohelcum TaxID=1015 RepID=A0A7Z9CHQ0_9FLAO|nr:CinA family nicotinamide mononucleotide deamidase-related protein [Bergeyella zoohelcum]VDH05746.1 Hypothetical domain / C-terminal domain of CinA type S [Bergeyella zoohelcum]
MVKAALIVIGDEILSGHTLDTNSQFITAQLREINIRTVSICTVPDSVDAIQKGLETASESADIIITTGGLGPTKDDKTKKAYQHFFNDALVLDESTFAHLSEYLNRKGRAHLLEINRQQAMVLSKAKVLQNHYGTAPCMQIIENDKMYFSLPGVPYELKHLVSEQIIPFLKNHFQTNYIETRFISVVDFPESLLSQHIESWELALPQHIQLSYLPIGNRVKLKIIGSGSDKASIKKELDNEIEKLQPLIGDKVISWRGDAIEEILGELLTRKKLTIGAAESCTGGAIARLLTSVSGSSNYMKGGIVSYATSIKTSVLGVSETFIKEKNVVSEEVAMAMAQGAKKLLQTDISIATTGVAGPNTDNENNEIGKICYAIIIGNQSYTHTLFLPHLDRKDFISFVAQRVLQDVVQYVDT